MTIFVLSVCLASCTQNIPIEEAEVQPKATTPIIEIPKPTIPQEEIMEKTTLRSIAEYPAYILDQCNVLWGIPATLQGTTQKEKIDIQKDDGSVIPMSEIDFFTLDGIIYITHHYTTTDSTGATADAIDHYKQTSGIIEQVETIPPKPAESRATFKGVNWTIETSVINGTEFSYLYNLDPEMIEAQGNAGGKGARMGAWAMISESVELDKGILIMTHDGALFWPVNRACGNEVSEKGRLWK
jgi:hypothetical protein